MREGLEETEGAVAPGAVDLPAGWRWVKLREVVREAQGGFACGKRDPRGVIQLRMNNVNDRGGFNWSSLTRVPCDAATIEDYQLRPGDVLFNNTNSTDLVGKSALFQGHEEPVVYSNHFTRIRTVAEVLSPAFLSMWLQAKWKERLFAQICNRWIGQSAVQREKLLELAMPVPSLQEQERIVAVFDSEILLVEKARKGLADELATVNALPGALLREAFSGRL